MNKIITILGLLLATMPLDAAQQSRSKSKFDLSKLHTFSRWLEDDRELTAEEYHARCHLSKIFFLADSLKNDDVAKIKDLVRDGVDVNAVVAVDDGLRDANGKTTSTALHVAAQWGCVRAVRELLKAPTIDINSIGVFKNSISEYMKIFQYMTPLMLAISQGKVVVTQATKKNWYHLDAAEEYEKIVELLIQHGAIVTTVKYDDSSTEDALFFAIKHGTPRMVKMLLDAGANVHATYQQGFWNYQTVLKNAIDRKDLDVLKMVLDAGADIEEEITVRPSFDKTIKITPLCYCLKKIDRIKGRLAWVEELLFRGAKMDASYDGETFESMIHKEYNDEAIKEILERVDNRRNKVIADAAEKILAPEFLLLDLAKIVSEYIAAPIGKS